MSNDELQKAIDDITSGDAAAVAADDSSTTSGTASVTLPDDLATGAPETDLNFTEVPDATAGASADIFAAPPAPDTSTAMPAGAEEPVTNPAVEAAPALDESSLGADPLAGFNPDNVTLNTTAPVAPTVAEPVNATETPAPAAPAATASELPTTDSLDAEASGTVNPEPASTVGVETLEIVPSSSATGDVVSEAKKELYPLLDKVSSMSNEEKCDVCIEVGGDALSEALKYAKGVTDETVKAEKLLQIIEKAK